MWMNVLRQVRGQCANTAVSSNWSRCLTTESKLNSGFAQSITAILQKSQNKASSGMIEQTSLDIHRTATQSGIMSPFQHTKRSANTSAESSCDCYDVGSSSNIKWQEGAVPREQRERMLNQRGCILWFTGLSGSGKSTVAFTLEHALHKLGKQCYVLDGDNIRHGLNKNLGFCQEDREENIRRIGEVAKLFAESGVITLVSFISPYAKDRQAVRERMGPKDFLEVYMKIPLAVCETRDPKGLYKAARKGEIKGFTGIDDPYEEPKNPEIVLDVSDNKGQYASPEDMATKLLSYLEKNDYLCYKQ